MRSTATGSVCHFTDTLSGSRNEHHENTFGYSFGIVLDSCSQTELLAASGTAGSEVAKARAKTDAETTVEEKASPVSADDPGPVNDRIKKEVNEPAVSVVKKLGGQVTFDEKSPKRPVKEVDLRKTLHFRGGFNCAHNWY